MKLKKYKNKNKQNTSQILKKYFDIKAKLYFSYYIL